MDPTGTETVLGGLVARLKLAVFLFRAGRQVYANQAADDLAAGLRARHAIDLGAAILDRLRAEAPFASGSAASTVTLLSSSGRKSLHVHIIPLDHDYVAVTVRELGNGTSAIRLPSVP